MRMKDFWNIAKVKHPLTGNWKHLAHFHIFLYFFFIFKSFKNIHIFPYAFHMIFLSIHVKSFKHLRLHILTFPINLKRFKFSRFVKYEHIFTLFKECSNFLNVFHIWRIFTYFSKNFSIIIKSNLHFSKFFTFFSHFFPFFILGFRTFEVI